MPQCNSLGMRCKQGQRTCVLPPAANVCVAACSAWPPAPHCAAHPTPPPPHPPTRARAQDEHLCTARPCALCGGSRPELRSEQPRSLLPALAWWRVGGGGSEEQFAATANETQLQGACP
jgi:hypothetical protein